MIIKTTLILVTLTLLSVQSAQEPFVFKNGIWYLENFESDVVGKLPRNLFNRNGDAKPNEHSAEAQQGYQYVVKKEDGNKFLRYEGTNAKHLNIPLVNSTININDTPVLSWRWRAHRLPEGANEDHDNLNDCVLSVYVVYEMNMFKIPKVIRYTWSTSLKKGKRLSKNFNNQKVIVLQSGEDKLGQWITEHRDIQADYKKLFGGKPPKKPLGILIMSDGDSTNSIAIGDYDDFMLMTKSAAAAYLVEEDDADAVEPENQG